MHRDPQRATVPETNHRLPLLTRKPPDQNALGASLHSGGWHDQADDILGLRLVRAAIIPQCARVVVVPEGGAGAPASGWNHDSFGSEPGDPINHSYSGNASRKPCQPALSGIRTSLLIAPSAGPTQCASPIESTSGRTPLGRVDVAVVRDADLLLAPPSLAVAEHVELLADADSLKVVPQSESSAPAPSPEG